MRIYLLAALVIIVVSCKQNEIKPQEDYSEFFGTDSINIDFKFTTIEHRNSEDGLALRLSFQTKDIFGGSNYGIVLSTFNQGNNLIVRFDSILEPARIELGTAPAEGYAELPESTENLILINGEKVDKYGYNITKEKVEIIPIDTSYTSIITPNFYRRPQNTFVYECYMYYEETNVYDDFLKIIEDSLNVTEFVFGGDAIIPYPEGWVYDFGVGYVKYFKYENESEFDKAGNLLYNYIIGNNINETTTSYIILTNWNYYKYSSSAMN